MPFVEKRLISPTSLTTSASTALYTVPTGYTAIVKQIVVTNTTGTAATFTMYIGAASAGNALFSGTSVAANDTVIINLSQVLGTGEILRALSGTNAALNLTVSGVENDGPLAQNAMYIADNAITSAKIADGAIVNADINASAAIDQSKIANLTSDLALKAPLASPTLTGTPLAPTANAATNTTQIATTAFVTTADNLKANIASPTFTGTFNASSALVIDSSGRVTTPLQPMFSAYPAVNYGTSGTSVIYHTATLNNIGGHFNTSNYRFTAPVAGVYHFSLNLNVYNVGTGDYYMPALYKNGSGLHYGDRQYGLGATDTNATVSASIYLAVSDYVQPYCISSASSYNFSGNHVWNSFTGILVG